MALNDSTVIALGIGAIAVASWLWGRRLRIERKVNAPVIPPEVAFDRYFHSPIPRESRRFRGKADLDRLRGSVLPAKLLEDIQRITNQALHNAKLDPLHAPHGVLHFDYIDSDESEAVAFSSDGYAFIGVTIGLVNRFWEITTRLSQASEVAAAIGLRAGFNRDLVQAQLFRLQLFYIVGHEWAHHVWGHVAELTPTKDALGDLQFVDEMRGTNQRGSLDRQTREVVVDGYSVYFLLQNLIVEEERARAIDLLGLDPNGDPHATDRILLSCFIVAVTGLMFARPPIELNAATAYTNTHPPQALRLRFVVMSSTLWAESYRHNLVSEITPERFRPLFRAAAAATRGMNGGVDWSAQIAFLETAEGSRYANDLIASRDAAVKGTGLSAPGRRRGD